MREKISHFFHEKKLSEEFLQEILEAASEFSGEVVLLQENIYMLCHQYDYSNPEKVITLLMGDTTLPVTEDNSGESEKRELGGFVDMSLLGLGGMGEVRRVFDKDLGCYLAMKILHERLCQSSQNIDRFHREAQVLAQLQHPNIPPIHRFGYLNDDRPYFIMREVEGRSLSEINYRFHHSMRSGTAGEEYEFRFRRLIDIFRLVCSAIGYAHHKGFLHSDLKPSNIMIGDFSEVLVVDWGLAKEITGTENLNKDKGLESLGASLDTIDLVGIEGTPSYMSPEQIKVEPLDERSDIFSLGAILYELLLGRAPYLGVDASDILAQRVSRTAKPFVSLKKALFISSELISICMKAMSEKREERYSSAHEMELEIEGWLDGVKAREKGMELVAQAEETKGAEEQCHQKVESLHIRLEELRTSIPAHAGEKEKQELWALEDEMQRLSEDANMQKSLREDFLQGALIHKPDLLPAHLGLIEHYVEEHQKAERERSGSTLFPLERKIQKHLVQIPPMQAQEFFDYLKGDGYLEFHVDEKEVHVDIQRYEIIGRRLVLGKKNILGVSPLERIRLEHGSYMLTLSKSGFENVQYPVFIERSAVWDTRHPHTGKSIQMLSKGRLQSGSCYVPGSWFLMGGDPDCASSLARKRCWLDSFVIQKFPVTNAEYLCYLNTLVARDKYEESLALVPRERSGKAGELGPMIYGFEKDKGYFLCPDADGDVWEEEYPVCFLDWGMAKDYADFQALETAMRWRLPVELEWEKAARGVDGRFFPWGFYLEPSWACVREAAKGRPLPSVVDSFLIDESPYGVRGMAGNMCDWTASVHKKLGSKIDEKGVVVQESEAKSSDYLSYRGGGWSTQARHARVTDRGAAFGSALGGNLSFRLVSSI